MGEIGDGTGSNYPASKDTNNSLEINSPNVGKTKARAEVVNDLAAAVVAIQNELGLNPAGSIADLVTYLQTEHLANGTHGTVTADSLEMRSGQIQESKGADVASASALPVLTDGNFFDVTGTTDIDTIASVGVGTFVTLQFDAILTINHDAADLILPGGLDIITAAGDTYTFFEYAAGDWIMTASSRTLIVGTVDTAQLADGAVTTPKIADDAVTDSKLARVWEINAVAPYTGTKVLGDSISDYLANFFNSTVTGTGSIANGSDSTDTYILCRADTINDYSYYDTNTEVTESGHSTIFKSRVKTDSSILDLMLWAGFTSDDTVNRSDSTPDIHGSLFRYATDVDGTAFWRCVTIAGTGASAEVTITTQSIAVNTKYDLEIRQTASEHTFYINGTLVATNNSTVPTSTTGMKIYIGATSLSNTGSARGILWNTARLIKEA